MTCVDDAQSLAEHVCAYLYAHDAVAQSLGVRIASIAPGKATLTMPVRKDMINSIAICHGEFIVSLADTALAFASHSDNQRSVVSSLTIDFVSPARYQDTLTACAKQMTHTAKISIYDVCIYNQHEGLIAVLRGRVHKLGEPVLPASLLIDIP